MENSITKKCSKCKEYKSLGEFHNDKDRPDGHSYVCRTCDNARGKKYYQDNIEERRAALQKYRDENREHVREKVRNWQRANKDKQRASVNKWNQDNLEKLHKKQKEWRDANKERTSIKTKKWAEANKDKRALTAEKRRAQKALDGGIITAKEWKDLKEFYGNKCLCCGKTDVRLTLDHVVPLSKGGRHAIENAQPLCGSCNSSKHTKIIDYRGQI